MNNKVYDNLKHLAQIGLPAAGTLYFALSQIWGLPHGEQIVGTIVATDAFLGILLGYSSKNYKDSGARYDGSIVVEETEEGKLFSLELESDPDELHSKDEVIFKVSDQ